jgi:hypothetical protein
MVERKSGLAAAYLEAIRALGVEDEVIVISFDWDFLDSLHRLEPGIRLGALGSGALASGQLDSIEGAGASTVVWQHDDVGAAEVARVHDRALELMVWTVNDVARIEQLIELGVDGIASDDPAAVAWRVDPGPALDCNHNGIADDRDLSAGSSSDCDGNGVPDECDLACGRLHDRDGDSRPDECPAGTPFVRGDPNDDGAADISDATFILAMLFLGGEETSCLRSADTNRDHALDLSDAVHLLIYLFLGGPELPPPFPGCGLDEATPLGCDAYSACP